MKLASFIYNHEKHYGYVEEHGVRDLFPLLGDKYPTLLSILQESALSLMSSFAENCPLRAFAEIEFLPVIATPGKILCVGMNYQDKRNEFNEKDPAPTLFIRFADSQVGHKNQVVKPPISSSFDYEGELAVIIGKTCRQVPAERALEYIAGYSCYMDGTVRDWQHSWYTAGKNWPSTGAFGPFLVTADEIADPQDLNIKTFLNGNIVQDDNTGNMIHKIPQLIAYISTFTCLSPGDVIITGSPGGVGMKRTPPLFLRDGDIIEVEIENIGRLSNTIVEYA